MGFDISNKMREICKEFDKLETIIRFQKIGLKDKNIQMNRLDKEIENLKKIIESDNTFKQIKKLTK